MILDRIVFWFKNTPQREKLRLIATIPLDVNHTHCIVSCLANCNGRREVIITPGLHEDLKDDLIYHCIIEKWLVGNIEHKYVCDLEYKMKEHNGRFLT